MKPAMNSTLIPQLRDACENLLETYTRHWIEIRLSGDPFRDPTVVERYAVRLVRRLSALGFDTRIYSTWEFLAESLKEVEHSCRWIVPTMINEYLNDGDYTKEEHARLRSAWEKEDQQSSLMSFFFLVVMEFETTGWINCYSGNVFSIPSMANKVGVCKEKFFTAYIFFDRNAEV